MRVITLNVGGGLDSGHKLGALLAWLRSLRVQVCFLQEVHGTANPRDLLAACSGAEATFGSRLLWFHSPGSASARGCLTLVDPGVGLSDISQLPDPTGGRVLRLDATLVGTPVSLVNVYAPAAHDDRLPFYRDVLPGLLPPPAQALLMGGDLNCILSVADAWYESGSPPATNTRLAGATALEALSSSWGLADLWQRRHPFVRGTGVVTHFSRAHPSGARLDRLLANQSLLSLAPLDTCDILPAAGVHTDHQPVLLQLRAPRGPIPYGKSAPTFPLLLLNMPDAVSALDVFLESALDPVLYATDAEEVVTAWLAAKVAIRVYACSLYHSQLRVARQAITAAEAAAAASAGTLAAVAPGLPTDVLRAMARASAAAVADAWQHLAAKSLMAADILDHLFGDSSSFYFHSQVKVVRDRQAIAALNCPGRAPSDALDTADLSNMRTVGPGLSHAERFFSSDSPCGLFRERVTNPAAQATLLTALPRCLTGEAAAAGEGPAGDSLLSPVELDWALHRARRGSAPGSDGLPYEFYHAFRERLIPVLLHVFNTAFQATGDGEPLARMLDGTICLLHKAGKPADELDGYRPLTLLNADVKLAMLVMSGRLQRPLEYLIDITQSAFLVGRDISDNVRYAQGLVARLDELGLPAWMLQSDLTKAYDSVDRGWLVRVMRHMGFQEQGVVRWAQVLLHGSVSRARVNGFLTPEFPVRSSLAQGSAVSCQEWLIAFQPLVSYLGTLASSGRITLPSGALAPVTTEFADDSTMVIVGPPASGAVVAAGQPTVGVGTTRPGGGITGSAAAPAATVGIAATHATGVAAAVARVARDAAVVQLVDTAAAVARDAYVLFHAAGGPAQSVQKSELVCLTGPRPLPPALDPSVSSTAPCGYRLSPLDVPIRLLGVFVAAAAHVCTSAAFSSMPGKLVAASLAWLPLRLNALGRAHVALQILASKAVYVSAFLSSSLPPFIVVQRDMQSRINQFVASSDLPEEEAPLPGRLFPAFAVSRLPFAQGGIGLPDLDVAFTAMRAKAVWMALGTYSAHPWRDLFLHELAEARTPGSSAPPGVAWVVACPTAGDPSAVRTPAYRESLLAFRKLGVHRIVEPASQSFHSVMRELTFRNPVSGDLQPAALTTLRARSWLRLTDLREARRLGLAGAEAADAAAVCASLPAPWRAMVMLTNEPLTEWSALSAPDAPEQVFSGPWPSPGPPAPLAFTGLWDLLATGRLEPRWAVPFTPAGPGRAVLVVTRDKPQHAFSSADYAFCADQRDLPPDQRDVPQDAFLVGAWSVLPVDPTVWGIEAKISLLDLTVKAARLCLLVASAKVGPLRVPGYAEDGAAYPALWAWQGQPSPPPPDPAQIPLEGVDDDLLGASGLVGIEARWRASAAMRTTDPDDPGPSGASPPSWLDTDTPREERIGTAERDQRAVQRAAAQPPAVAARPVPRPGFKKVWQRINDRSIHRPFRITAWRVLHGSLGCNAFLHHVRRKVGGDPGSAFCPLPCCAGKRHVEDLTHVFLDCPAARPVITWLVDTWRALTNKEVPRDPAFLLADDPAAGWPGCGSDPWLLRMWTRLRVATLGAIWRVRCRVATGLHPEASMDHHALSHRSARMAAESLLASIARDWRRVESDVRTLDGGVFCADWWRGLDVKLSLEVFAEEWARGASPAFCRVRGEDLEYRLRVGDPVALPPAQPPPRSS